MFQQLTHKVHSSAGLLNMNKCHSNAARLNIHMILDLEYFCAP